MGLIIDVLRASRFTDATNGGISATHNTLTVVNVSGPFDPTPDRPAVLLVDGGAQTKRIVPAVQQDDGSWWMLERDGMVGPMMGGNYAATSDSRFREAVGFYGAVAIHDRYETVEQYEALTT